MKPDFTPYIMAGEEIMWQGESHKEGPPADPKGARGTKFFGILWSVLSALIFIPVIFLTGDLKGSAFWVTVGMAVLFIGIGIGLFFSTKYYKQEYYCLTDRRLLVMDTKNILTIRDLFHIQGAELTGIQNGYGSILMRTDITHRHRTNGHYHTTREMWSMRGVEEPAECYRILTSVLMVNSETNFK